MAFANDAQFVSWLKEVHDFNEAHGMRSLRLVAVQELLLSPIHTLATVRWGAQFEKTGDRLIEFEISYFLEGTSLDYRILAYVSQRDQSEEMKRLGLL
jgi:hypothetical protein